MAHRHDTSWRTEPASEVRPAESRPPNRKAGYFLLEGLNAFAAAYYFNYQFFFLRDHFGFGNRCNLLASALHGLIYVCAAWFGGQFAQRHGYFTALRLGFGGMGLALAIGSLLSAAIGQLVVLAGWTLAMCFTWPTLEALISENETDQALSRMVGIYNVVWAGSSAVAYFAGGAIIEWLGERSIYWLPACIHLAQLALLPSLSARSPQTPAPIKVPAPPPPHKPEEAAFHQPVRPETFLKLAWLANPFAYVAIYTVLAAIPSLARRLELSTAESGFFCSLWFFVRLGAFIFLWRWSGWHYRFRWLLAAFVALILSFATLLLAGQFWVLLLAQVAFGAAVGLIYYSSLFYSMDVGETKGEHGGFHEAAIGAGIFAGPAFGAAALQFFPRHPHSGTWAVSGLLLAGLAGMIWLRLKK